MKLRHRTLAAAYWAAVIALALPLGLVALTSLADGPVVGFPLGRLGFRWYASALSDPDYRRAFALSAGLACGSAALAVLIGAWIALAATALGGWAGLALMAGGLLPLVTPGIVHAIALRMAIAAIGLDPGPAAVMLGHAVHATPYAAIMVWARYAALPDGWLDAAADLGAGTLAAFVHIVLPWLRPALLAAGGLAALTSFDDFIRSFFLGGYDPTLPVTIFGRLRSGLSPEINAVATLVLLAAVAAGWMADRFTRAVAERPAVSS